MATTSAKRRVGVGRAELGAPVLGTGMMGWGMLDNVVEGVATPLHARAFVIAEGESTGAIVCLELAFISIAVKRRVVERLAEVTELEGQGLALGDANLMLCATHTHSAPGGYTEYPFYNITIPGFVPAYVETIADAVLEALRRAARGLVEGELRFAEGEFGVDSTVAFNRSVASYNRNVDVDTLDERATTEALDRTMRLLRFEDASGRVLGSINWFAVHCTSVHSDNRLQHFDNKGYAAKFTEAAGGRRGDQGSLSQRGDQGSQADQGHVAAFAQAASGDVTPNYKTYDQKPWVRGASVDDDESARINGRMQADQAIALERAAGERAPLARGLDLAHTYVDFSQVEVPARHADGQTRRTGPAEIGWSMLFGTEEGPGIDRRLLFTQRWLQGARKLRGGAARREVQGDKLTVIESGRARMFGVRRLSRLAPAGRLSPAVAQLVALDHSSRPDAKPWTPQVLPIQIFQIGELAIAAVPAEFTTVAGKRLRAAVARAAETRGVRKVVLCGYANAYAGYVTTPEEYAVQDYEGASTHFGTWTLGAYMSEFEKLAEQLGVPDAQRSGHGPRPPRFGAADFEGRVYSAP